MRLFLMGDSFTENLFRFWYNGIEKAKTSETWEKLVNDNEIAQYLIYLEKHGYERAKYFEDILSDLGYEVYNFGRGGCTIEDIIYQFSNLLKFKRRDDDRIILNWTHPSRFNWIREDKGIHYVHANWDPRWGREGDPTGSESMLLKQQAINRENSFFGEYYLNRNLLPFMEYLVEVHDRYKPIVWTPFADLDRIISNQKWLITFIGERYYGDFLSMLPNNLSIVHETNGLFKDNHFGRAGNYYIATLFDEVIKSNLGPNYMDHKHIFDITLKRIKLENKDFKI